MRGWFGIPLLVCVVALLVWFGWRPPNVQADGADAPWSSSASETRAIADASPAELLVPNASERALLSIPESSEERSPMDNVVRGPDGEVVRISGRAFRTYAGPCTLKVRLTGWVAQDREQEVDVIVLHKQRRVHNQTTRLHDEVVLSGISGGDYQVLARTPYSPYRASELISLTLSHEQPETELLVPIQPCPVIRGTVSSRGGGPLEEFQLVDSSQPIPQYSYFPWSLDDYGGFEAHFPVGMPIQVQVTAPGHHSLSAEYDMQPGQVLWVDWELEPTRPVGGIVYWPDGTPASGVEVFGRTEREWDHEATGADGRFTLEALSRRDLKLYARGGGAAGQDFSNRWLFDASSDLTQLELWLAPSAQYALRLVGSDEAPIAGWEVILTAADNAHVTRRGTLDEQGRVTVTGLYPGTYHVKAQKLKKALGTIEVRAGEIVPEQLFSLPNLQAAGDARKKASFESKQQW